MSELLSESLLRKILFERSWDAVILFNSQGILESNEAAAAMLRMPDTESLVGRQPDEFLCDYQTEGSSLREKRLRIEALLRQKENHRFDWLCRRADGDEFACEISLTSVKLSSGEGFVGVFRELTERTIERAKLHRVQSRLNHALNGGNVGLWDWDLGTDEVFYSDQWHRQLGEVPGTLSQYVDWESRVHLDDLPGAIQRVQDLFASPRIEYESSFRMRHASGEFRWILARGKVYRDTAGQPTRLLGVHLDVTDQKQHEQRLSKELHLSEVMLQTLESTLKITSLEELCTTVCKQARRLLGAEIAGIDLCHSLNQKLEVHGRSYSSKYQDAMPSEAVPSTAPEQWKRPQAASPVPDDIASCELFRNLDHEGVLLTPQQLQTHPLGAALVQRTPHRPGLRGLLACALYDGDERTLGAIWLSDKEEADFDPGDQAVFRQLAYVVSILIVRLHAEQELRDQKELLDESNEELEQFAYVASHDLQQPLRAISNYAEFIEEDFGEVLGDEGRRFLRLQVAAAKRMKKLIDDLLQYSRVSRDEAFFSEVDFQEVVEEAIRRLEVAIAETGAVIRCEALPVVRGIESRLCQLMQNLIGNAIKYKAADRNPVITISATEQSEHWLFTVEDNGVGIDAKFYTEVFQVFRRLHDGGNIEGTGIGLALCKRIVQRHGGGIWVQAAAQEGSQFCFQILK
ncbi:Phytochrome-like protein cph1 [Novipirellula galeiformis]|uniref:histidine kinase n=1 Tax=Novipirellula galeiformis TaxID=2528004 RepID=A0A5C6CSQ6_9BACT|nr:ATP-binding protein [Novipirellula galeiformis]TWU26915.1 Phytochrome-like protein cph1 [Novipirellula galeiformis]